MTRQERAEAGVLVDPAARGAGSGASDRASDRATDRATDRARGALVGLAVGDALGTTVEFQRPGSFEPVTDMVGGGVFGLEPGQWTDDTSMALCLAESLVARRGFDPTDQLQRYVRWWRDGHLSSTGSCFDIGNTTAAALRAYEETGEPDSGPTDPHAAGNGSLMRLSPVAIAYRHSPAEAVRLAGESSRTTHGAAECVDACRWFAGLLVGAIHGRTKAELLAPDYRPYAGAAAPATPAVRAVAAGSYLRREPPDITASGYVIDTLEAALWAFARSNGFEEAVLAAVNLGRDADTVGAVCGQLAGAHYGESAIPTRWRERLALGATIGELVDGLLALA